MKDFTEGSIVKSLFGLAIPIVLTNLLHSMYQLIDTYWVGRLGETAVAAVSLSFPIIFLMITLGGGFSIAGTILIAHSKGSKNQEQIDHIAAQTVILMLIVSILVSILGYFISEPLLKLMGADAAVLPQAVSYLKISFLGMVFLFSFFVFQSIMRGVGETRLPLYIVFTTVLMNAILDPIFIMGWGPIPAFGVTGAAITTVCTQAVATIIGTIILLKGKNGINLVLKNFKFDRGLVKKMFFLGLPASVEQATKALGFMIMSFLVATFGTTIVAAYGIGIRVLSFVIIPAFGISMATSTLVGQNMGAGKKDRAEQIAHKSASITFGLLALVGMIFYIFAAEITAAFIPGEEAVIAAATQFVKFLSFSFAFMGVQLVLSGVFSGSGNTRISMIFSIVALWIYEFPLSYILSKHTSLGEKGIWIAAFVASILSMITSVIYFRMGRWKETQVLSARTKMEDEVIKETMIEEGA